MDNLAVKTQNKRGNTPQYKENLGYVTTFFPNEKLITVDNYKSQGDTYEKREEPQITIQDKGKVHFVGTFQELINKLK